jgi:hypothetical protein
VSRRPSWHVIFFHIINSAFIPDTLGLDCLNLAGAKDEAVRIAGAMLKDQELQL